MAEPKKGRNFAKKYYKVMSSLIAKEYQGFEQIKHIDETDNEYWFARELALVLEYVEWRNFSKVIDRAMLACQNSGFNLAEHFVEVNKTIEMPIKLRKIGFVEVNKTKTKSIIDYKLSRYACYLIVQNGDPRKEIIASDKRILRFKRVVKKLLIISINLMRITSDWSFVAISNNGIKCLQKLLTMPVLLPMKNLRNFKMRVIWGFTVAKRCKIFTLANAYHPSKKFLIL